LTGGDAFRNTAGLRGEDDVVGFDFPALRLSPRSK
jgi:hypothetical protein